MSSVERKVIVGLFSTSKKSALLRCASRSGLEVETDSVFRVAVKARSSPPSATTSSPSTSVNWPRAFEMPAWRTVNAAEVWAGSRVQVPGVRSLMRCLLLVVVRW